MSKPWKIPVSVLVVIHTPDLRILLLERTDHPGWWQSVTGSQEAGETLVETVAREVREETGLDVTEHRLIDWDQSDRYEIYECYRHRYPPGVTHNTEHVFSLQVPDAIAVSLAPAEHLAYQWTPWQAAAESCFSPSNAAAILRLSEIRSGQHQG
ncbi:MAG: dihydroneopterin triphosphate diphosphatase [Hydrogenophilales bacterium]|nr:dihydroneopterin triphosphate diphosphatase [Hydrogenophilales bacterium]